MVRAIPHANLVLAATVRRSSPEVYSLDQIRPNEMGTCWQELDTPGMLRAPGEKRAAEIGFSRRKMISKHRRRTPTSDGRTHAWGDSCEYINGTTRDHCWVAFVQPESGNWPEHCNLTKEKPSPTIPEHVRHDPIFDILHLIPLLGLGAPHDSGKMVTLASGH